MANESHHHGHHHGSRELPADLNAPREVLVGWRKRAYIWAIVSGLLSLIFLFTGNPLTTDHFFRAWILGLFLTLGTTIGGMALLMVQYLSGGKWGLVLRRPLEAMSRCVPLIALFFIPAALGMKRLYLYSAIPYNQIQQARIDGTITVIEAHCLRWKHVMLNTPSVLIQTAVCIIIWLLLMWKLNAWSLQREADPHALDPERETYWRRKFENLSGPGVILYAFTLTCVAIDWVMAMDVTWYSSIWGLLYLVGQGFSVLALGIMTVILLSRWQPYATVLRVTEQQDLGKLTFAFVMLNIYLAFSQFLIIWSGNSPEEIPWYLYRFGGGWAYIITLDFIFHWAIPFGILLSKNFKRNKRKMVLLCKWIIFARAWDLWWQIEPGFKDARRNLHWSVGMCAYFVIPIFMGSLWLAYYFTQLMSRPVFVRNDPHVEGILEAEHVHA